jgi:hypothetical protein
MKEYFIVVITVIFIGGTIVSLAPEGTGQRYLRLLVSLAVTGCIIMPLFSFFGGGEIDTSGISDLLSWQEENTQNYEEIYNNSILKAGAREVENKLKSEILQALDGDYDDIDLRIVAEQKSGEIYIERTEIIIYPSGVALDPHFMENYVSERLRCECEVIYKSE